MYSLYNIISKVWLIVIDLNWLSFGDYVDKMPSIVSVFKIMYGFRCRLQDRSVHGFE